MLVWMAATRRQYIVPPGASCDDLKSVRSSGAAVKRYIYRFKWLWVSVRQLRVQMLKRLIVEAMCDSENRIKSIIFQWLCRVDLESQQIILSPAKVIYFYSLKCLFPHCMIFPSHCRFFQQNAKSNGLNKLFFFRGLRALFTFVCYCFGGRGG